MAAQRPKSGGGFDPLTQAPAPLTALQRIGLGVRSLGIRAPRPLRTTSETLPEETP